MLIIAESMRELSFGKLMEVYAEGNLENGRDLWPELPEGQQLLHAEQAFYQYLTEVFYRTSGAAYAIMEQEGSYVSALRLEPYRDGLLLEALETDPGKRRKGHAESLIRDVQVMLRSQGAVKLYSHVHKRNIPSLRIHEKCGFHRISEIAVYIDGSVNDRCCTLCYEK